MLPVFSSLPGQIEGIDGNAMPSEARSRIKRHKSKRFRPGRINHFPDVDSHRLINNFEFVYQSDVDGPESVFQQLGCFGGPAGGNRNNSPNRPPV